jgi:hypothetical protein
MSEKKGLLGQRVKSVLRRSHPQTPREIIRGIITEADEFGIRISGRRFQEILDQETGHPAERPVESDTRMYWVPFYSIRYSEIILPGSASERDDNEMQRRKVLSPQELIRQTSG